MYKDQSIKAWIRTRHVSFYYL